jgi:hypothetical protein
VKVRRHGFYRSNTFDTKREAKDGLTGMASKANHVSSSGFSPIPKGATRSYTTKLLTMTKKRLSADLGGNLLNGDHQDNIRYGY